MIFIQGTVWEESCMGGHLHKTVLIKKMQEGLGTKNLTSVNLPILNIRNDISLGMTKKMHFKK